MHWGHVRGCVQGHPAAPLPASAVTDMLTLPRLTDMLTSPASLLLTSQVGSAGCEVDPTKIVWTPYNAEKDYEKYRN